MWSLIIVIVLILILVYIWNRVYCQETFANTQGTTELLVFISDTCSHCQNYLDNNNKDVVAFMQSKRLTVQTIKSDGSKVSNDLFNKYNVQFVPTGILIKNGKPINLGSNINVQSVKNALEQQ